MPHLNPGSLTYWHEQINESLWAHHNCKLEITIGLISLQQYLENWTHLCKKKNNNLVQCLIHCRLSKISNNDDYDDTNKSPNGQLLLLLTWILAEDLGSRIYWRPAICREFIYIICYCSHIKRSRYSMHRIHFIYRKTEAHRGEMKRQSPYRFKIMDQDPKGVLLSPKPYPSTFLLPLSLHWVCGWY